MNRRILVTLSALLLLGTRLVFAQAGASGMPLLKIGATARDVGMGYVVALADGPAAVQGNPAGLQSVDTPRTMHLLFTHQEWIQDTRTEFLGASFPLGANQTLGLSLLTTTVADIEIRTRPGPAEGTFTSRDLAIGLSYARTIGNEIRLGVTGRFLYEKILVNEATGISFDAGIRAPLPIANLDAGIAILNLGSMTVLQSQSTVLPALARAGLGYTLLRSQDMDLRVEGDVVRVFPEKRFYAGLGGEFWFYNMVVLRAGNEFGSEGRGFGAGLGVQYGLFSLDYAFASLNQDLGSTHTFTLGLTL
ncbi:MAG: PorV/PorQ family protein [Bacteroidota bacterium]